MIYEKRHPWKIIRRKPPVKHPGIQQMQSSLLQQLKNTEKRVNSYKNIYPDSGTNPRKAPTLSMNPETAIRTGRIVSKTKTGVSSAGCWMADN